MAEVTASSEGTSDFLDIHQVGLDWAAIEEEIMEEIIMKSEGNNATQCATLPQYVPNIGRGTRKRPDPRDIKLPRIYYDNLRHKAKRSAGRGKVLRNHSGQNFPGRVPRPGAAGSADSNQPPKLDENFLGGVSRGLTSEIMQGKACLMERFLGKPVTDTRQEGHVNNPFESGHHHHSSNSLRSARTAPYLNLDSKDHWPDINGGPCHSDCGATKGPSVLASAHPTKSFSLQDVLKAISTSPSCNTSSQDSSRKGNRKWRKAKTNGGNGTQDETQATTTDGERILSSSEGTSGQGQCAAEAAKPDATTREESPDSESENQQGGVPGGSNLIQIECLPDDITEQQLSSVMYGFGPVISCDILRDSDSQKCIGIAFVRFETNEACTSAISCLNGQDSPFHDAGNPERIPQLVLHMVT